MKLLIYEEIKCRKNSIFLECEIGNYCFAKHGRYNKSIFRRTAPLLLFVLLELLAVSSEFLHAVNCETSINAASEVVNNLESVFLLKICCYKIWCAGKIHCTTL